MVAVIGFDLDMTLIDSRPQILGSFGEVARSCDVAIDIMVVESRLGLKLEDELAYWFPPNEIDEAAAIYRRHYRALAAETELLAGVRESFAAARAIGAHVAIVTAKHESSVGPCLEATGLEPDSLYSFVHGEEKAEVLRLIGATLYVGDTPADMRASVRAEAFAVGVATGAFDANALTDGGAQVVIPSLLSFPELLASMSV